jgi:NFU1 iron-sulfur cluster scaffold homolog, mitochondrial
MTNEIETKIKEILDKDIRPAVQMDGGDIEFKKYENNIVYVRLKGACQGCPGATMTLKMGVEARLKKEIPEIKQVVQV